MDFGKKDGVEDAGEVLSVVASPSHPSDKNKYVARVGHPAELPSHPHPAELPSHPSGKNKYAARVGHPVCV